MVLSHRAAVLVTLAAAAIWGTSFSVNDMGLADVGPATFVVLRFAIAAAVVLGIAAWLGRFDASIARDPWLWLLALANALGYIFQYFGQTYTTPVRTALFVNTSAFFTAILERILFRAPVRTRRLLAILLGVGGAAILVTGGDVRSLSGGRFVGDILVLGAGFAWAVYTVMNSRALQTGDALNFVGWTFLLTTVIAIPALAMDAAPLVVPPRALAAVLYTGLISTAAAFGLWAWGLRTLRGSTSNVLLLFEIAVATALGVIVFQQETLGTWDLIGGGVLIGAVVWMTIISATEVPPSTLAHAERDAQAK